MIGKLKLRFFMANVEGFRDLMTGDNAYDAKGLGTLYLMKGDKINGSK